MNKKKSIYSAWGLILLCGIIFARSQIVSFHDKELERVVRDYMMSSRISMLTKREKPIRGPILRKDINAVEVIFIDLNEYKINDMRDTKKFKNLQELMLGYIPEDFQAEVIPNGDMPKNLDSLYELEKLERINLFRMNIDNSFKTMQTSAKELFIDHCIVVHDNFMENFPEINLLVVRNSDISSFEFLETTQSLDSLCLYNNTYGCSLDQLKIARNIEELRLTSNETDVFEQLPYIPTIKKLYLQGDGAPKRTEAEKYLSWENLEGLYLEDEKYDVATNTWSDY